MLYLIFSVAVSFVYYAFGVVSSVRIYLCLCPILLITMPPKRVTITSSAPRKRVKVHRQGTYSQPVVLEESQQLKHLSPYRALVKSRLSNDTLESQLR
jgi:hypothetical protein